MKAFKGELRKGEKLVIKSNHEREKARGLQKFERFIEEVANSMVKLDLLIFFSKNVALFDTAEGLAQSLGRRKESIADELDYLCRRGFLEKVGKPPEYRLTRDSKRQKQVIDFVESLNDRTFRLKAIAKIVKMDTAKKAS